jgi:hypothetical protein
MFKRSNHQTAKVADTDHAQQDQNVTFRRKSVNAGADAQLLVGSKAVSSLKRLSLAEINDSLVPSIAESFVLHSTGMNGNPEVYASEWVDAVLPTDEVFAKKVLKAIMISCRPVFKMSRYGYMGKLLLIVLLTYNDEGTDIQMMITYEKGGEATAKYFRISLAILVVQTMIGLAMSLIQNGKRSMVAKVKGAVLTLLQLQPILHAYAVWRGDELSEEDNVSPFNMFMIQRCTEIVFEVLPEVRRCKRVPHVCM